MDKYIQDANFLALQNAAYDAANQETNAHYMFSVGKCSEAFVMQAMAHTEKMVALAIAAGVSRKDLPAA